MSWTDRAGGARRSGFEYLASKLSQIEAEKPAEDAAEDSREEAPAAEEDEDEERVREDEEEGDAEEGEGVLAEVSEEGDEPVRLPPPPLPLLPCASEPRRCAETALVAV
eukprot:620001-Rhodomonas_salina.1